MILSSYRFPARDDQGASPLVIVHGLYGSARNWSAMARGLSATREVVTIDQRNHGESPHARTQSYPDMAQDLADTLTALTQDGLSLPVDLLGHSMGGKAAMQLALTAPDGLLRRLVVADIAPVAYAHDQAQHVRAMRALDLKGLTERREADRRLAADVADPDLRAFFLQSLDLRAEGGPRWRLNLDVLEAEMPQIIGWPATEGQFHGAALFLSGAESSYVRPEHRATILRLFPKARFAKIPSAGHWLHADAPEAFAETVRIFLDAPGS
jgi:esterase